MNYTKNVEITLDEHFPPYLLRHVENAFKEDYSDRLLRIIQAIILSRRHGYFEELDPNLTMELKPLKSKLKILLNGIPKDKLVRGKLIKMKELQIVCGIRDILLSRQYPLTETSPEGITDYIFHFVRNAGILTKDDQQRNHYGRIMIQGGHHIPKIESTHHKRLGYRIGLLGLELITGSGPGSMEDPMKGAIRGYQMNRLKRKFIGITEDGIISGEPCNDYIDHLIVFPDIEKRLEAFIRMSKAGIILPGGPGTFEEILTILWIKTHPANKNFRFPLYFCQPVQSGDYFENIIELLNDCFDTDFSDKGYIKFFISDAENKTDPALDPRRIADELYEEMRENYKRGKKAEHDNGIPYFPLWDWDVYFPERLQKPLEIKKDFIESLTFSRKSSMTELFFSLRSLSSAIVECNVRDRDFIKRNGLFELKGDKSILRKVDKLFQAFAEAGRMGGRSYECPYKIIGE
jgi:predicted Rossmann-fold nucleotide-binding protein